MAEEEKLSKKQEKTENRAQRKEELEKAKLLLAHLKGNIKKEEH